MKIEKVLKTMNAKSKTRASTKERTYKRTTKNERTHERARANKRTNEPTNDETANKNTHERTNEQHENHAKIALGTLPGRPRDGPGGPKIEQKSLQSALGATLGDPGALGALPEPSRTALGRTRDGPWRLPGRPRDGLGHSREDLGRLQDASESARDEFFA